MAWVPFSKNKFKDKGLSQKQDLSPYKTTIAVPIYKFEFASLVSQIPLLFVKGEPGFIFCGLMGIERNKNLFIDELGVWTGDFCPSFFPNKVARKNVAKISTRQLDFLQESLAY